MIPKIFVSILLLTCVYSYMLKSFNRNNDSNFQKLSDNLNFEFQETQIIEPNLYEVETII